MIPKTIHYIWFGGKPLPPLAKKCIDSWRRHMPQYEIRRWDESNFDISFCPYTAKAYADGKYAFVSDVARFWILHRHGGVYLDTDVELIKPIDDILEAGPFMACEDPDDNRTPHSRFGVAPGLGIAAPAGHPFYKEILDFYRDTAFEQTNSGFSTITVVATTTSLLAAKGLVRSEAIQCIDGINIYPPEYFAPMDFDSGRISLTPNTRAIHHYAASWFSTEQRIYFRITRMLGPGAAKRVGSVWKFVKHTILRR